MSFVAPLWLAAAGLVGAGVLIAHLFSSTVPPQDVLPTVRFIPESTPLAVMRSRRVTDWLLLFLRLAVVAALGLALSGAQFTRTAPSRIVLLDASRAVASISAAADSAIVAANGAPIIVFDSMPRQLSAEEARRLTTTGGRGWVSAAVASAHRAIAPFTDGRAHTELVIVSPLVREEVDAATEMMLSQWEGPIRIIRMAAAAAPSSLAAEMRSIGDDPVTVAVAMAGARGAVGVRVVRNMPTRADSQWASAGGALVLWPAAKEGAVLRTRAVADSQGGVIADGHVVVASFSRAFEPHNGVVVARWIDGAPAATETAVGRGCIREVAIPVDVVGDVALRESFHEVVRTLLAPCGGARDFRAVSLNAHGGGVAAPVQPQLGAMPIILGLLALAALVAEQATRNKRRAA